MIAELSPSIGMTISTLAPCVSACSALSLLHGGIIVGVEDFDLDVGSDFGHRADKGCSILLLPSRVHILGQKQRHHLGRRHSRHGHRRCSDSNEPVSCFRKHPYLLFVVMGPRAPVGLVICPGHGPGLAARCAAATDSLTRPSQQVSGSQYRDEAPLSETGDPSPARRQDSPAIALSSRSAVSTRWAFIRSSAAWWSRDRMAFRTARWNGMELAFSRGSELVRRMELSSAEKITPLHREQDFVPGRPENGPVKHGVGHHISLD